MADIVALAAAVVAVMFIVSVIGKLDDWAAWCRAVEGWDGLSASLRGAIRRILPVVEASAAIWLIWIPPAGLVYAGVLLIGFAAGAYYVRLRSGAVRCACFGSLGETTITASLIVRNAILGMVAVGVGGLSFGTDTGPSEPWLALLGAGMASIAVVVATEYWRLLARTKYPTGRAAR